MHTEIVNIKINLSAAMIGREKISEHCTSWLGGSLLASIDNGVFVNQFNRSRTYEKHYNSKTSC